MTGAMILMIVLGIFSGGSLLLGFSALFFGGDGNGPL